MHCRATSRPEPRSRPPCGVGVAAAAGLTRRLLASYCLPSAACRLLSAACCLPPVTCHLLPTARRLLPATCYLPSVACRLGRPHLPPVTYRLPTTVCYLRPSICCPSRPLPSICRPLSAAFRLPPVACHHGRPPSAAPAERRTSPPATTPTLPPIRLIDATIGIAPAPLSDMPPQFRMQFPEDSHPRRPTNRRISTI